MITKWKVSNFKSIRELPELDFRPLTIFAGANSSGKSTLIQSILLIAQTLANKVISRPIILNGDLISLGQLDDLRSYGGQSEKISIKYTYEPPPHEAGRLPRGERRFPYFVRRPRSLKHVTCEISFDAGPSESKQRELYQIQPRLLATDLSCKYRDKESSDARIVICNSNEEISVPGKDRRVEDERMQANLVYTATLDPSSRKDIEKDFESTGLLSCNPRHFLPDVIKCEIDNIREEATAIVWALESGDFFRLDYWRPRRVVLHAPSYRQLHPINERLLLSGAVGDVLRDILKDRITFEKLPEHTHKRRARPGRKPDKLTIDVWADWLMETKPEEYRVVRQALKDCPDLSERIYAAWKEVEAGQGMEQISFSLPWVTEATGYLEDFFTSSLKYLGPLRDEPKPLYPLAPVLDPDDVGRRGEHTASVLELHKNKKVTYIPSNNFKSKEVRTDTVNATLGDAVADWLQHLDMAKSVESTDRGKLGHELRVRIQDPEDAQDLTHVGVGVSQVLPILVMCLLAGTDSTLIIEQPELHLHPKVQAMLGDFFLSIALSGKQCIVETHSEYLIDRLRLHIAQSSPKQKLVDQTKVYFVEKPDQSSEFREVAIDEYGAITDWPEGFFDQSQEQAAELLHAATMKRKANRNRDSAPPS